MARKKKIEEEKKEEEQELDKKEETEEVSEETIDMSDTFVADVGQKSAIAKLSSISDKEKDDLLKDDYYDDGHKNKNPLGIIFLIILCLVIGAGGSYYFFEVYNVKNNDKTTKKEAAAKTKKEDLKQELNVESLFVRDLFARYDYQPVLGISKYDYLYKEDKTLVKDLDDDYVRVVAAADAQSKSLFGSLTFTGENFQDSVSKLFGSDYTLENESIENDDYCANIKYNEKDNTYKISKPECGGTGTIDLENKIVKASIIDKKQVTINVAIAILDSSQNKVYKKYDSEAKDKEDTFIDEVEDAEAETFSIDKDYSKLNQYKYTFDYDLENNNYYLVSIELDK